MIASNVTTGIVACGLLGASEGKRFSDTKYMAGRPRAELHRPAYQMTIRWNQAKNQRRGNCGLIYWILSLRFFFTKRIRRSAVVWKKNYKERSYSTIANWHRNVEISALALTTSQIAFFHLLPSCFVVFPAGWLKPPVVAALLRGLGFIPICLGKRVLLWSVILPMWLEDVLDKFISVVGLPASAVGVCWTSGLPMNSVLQQIPCQWRANSQSLAQCGELGLTRTMQAVGVVAVWDKHIALALEKYSKVRWSA